MPQHFGDSGVGNTDTLMFNLRHIARVADTRPFGQQFDLDDVRPVLDEAARFSAEQLLPLYRSDNSDTVVLRDGSVSLPTGWLAAYRKYVDSGWNSLSFDPAFGGGGLPYSVEYAVTDLLGSDNVVFTIGTLLTKGAAQLLCEWARPDTPVGGWTERLVSGSWAATMNLTEPEAGSDLGALRSAAAAAPEGHYLVKGTKIFITFGDHDLTDNIVHLVLARREGAPTGTRGISCFAVPKYLPDGSRNDVTVVSIENKVGIHGSPTCVMSYGDNGGAIGWLLGEPEGGLECMFTMMNAARLATGQQGVVLAHRATDLAHRYAHDRRQGRAVGTDEYPSQIILHPDVRRLIAEARATVEAMRALSFAAAGEVDRLRHGDDPAARGAAAIRLGLLTPLVKGWVAERGVELCSDAMQVFGGMGYIEETGIAQYWRDARIAPIYEGTTAIQARDLVVRKIDHGNALADLLEESRRTAAELQGFHGCGDELQQVIDTVTTATAQLRVHLKEDPRRAAALFTPYLRMVAAAAAAAMLARGVASAQAAGENPSRELSWLRGYLPLARASTRYAGELIKDPADPFEIEIG